MGKKKYSKGHWQIESNVRAAASTCDTIGEFAKNFSGAYHYALKHKLIDSMFSPERGIRSTAEFIQQAEERHGVGTFDYSEVDYKDSVTKVKIRCFEHGVFKQLSRNHLRGLGGCPRCVGRNKSTEDFIAEATVVHGDKYDYSSAVYVGSKTKVKIICFAHGVFEQEASSHLRGKGCPACRNCGNSERFTFSQDRVIKDFKKTHGDRYDYSEVEYTGADHKITILCKTHGSFRQTAASHKSGSGCPDCGTDDTAKARKRTTSEIINNFKKIHNDLYDYSETEFIDRDTKLTIICRKEGHGRFEQLPDNHLAGKGCSLCAIETRADNRRDTVDQFIAKARTVHGYKYQYIGDYRRQDGPVTIICPFHGAFIQNAASHINAGCGCPKCSMTQAGLKRRVGTVEFIERAQSEHGNRYDYSDTECVMVRDKVEIRCREHGVFSQIAAAHLAGAGCPSCALTVSSDNDLLYIHMAEDVFRNGIQVYKVGVTSQRRPDTKRQGEVEKELGSTLTNILYMPIKAGTAMWFEKAIHREVGTPVTFTYPNGAVRTFGGYKEYLAINDLDLSRLISQMELFRVERVDKAA